METSKQQNNNEGYIKFNLYWEQKKFDFSDEQFKLLNTTREKLYQLNLIGAYTGGIGFGNISIREVKNRFIISGSATGNFSNLKKEHYALVDKFNINENLIHCIGLSKASSESLSHAAIYATNSVVNAIIHVHHKKMWEKYVNTLPTSDKKAEFGTPEIALEIQKLAKADNGIIIMGGHPEGIISYGKTMDLAFRTLIKYSMAKVAIIGGSGLEDPNILKSPQYIKIKTPYGEPSSELTTGKIGDVEVVILSRHGKKHTIPPTQVNNRANIWALKEVGCSYILATTACGSLREEIDRGHLVILDQFIDFTKHRVATFHEKFENGEMKHHPMADPFDGGLREKLILSAQELNLNFHPRGTVITIEGPRFSTRAESKMFRMWGADVINMSIAPEVILANEIGIPYAAIAMSTDYDCWKTDEEAVTWEAVLEIFNQNVHNVIDLILGTLKKI